MNAAQSTPTQMFPLDGGSTPVTAEPLAREEVNMVAFERARGFVNSIASNMEATQEVTPTVIGAANEDTLENTPAYAPPIFR